MELLIELFWEVRENKHLAEMPLPLAHFFHTFTPIEKRGAVMTMAVNVEPEKGGHRDSRSTYW